MDKNKIEELLRNNKSFLADQFYVKRIGLFGSYVRNENHENSDIDLLVEFERPVGFEFIELKNYLESLFNMKVDLVTEAALKPLLRDQVLNEVQYQ